ncbi:hypothetical protein Tco_1056894 [Tanacetum coccineum]|uniref:Uncharacterized protein n=1 Tax=Tanacetum coccineum TaxID=301880 RepID=A0ABQ5H5R3_9ASTR
MLSTLVSSDIEKLQELTVTHLHHHQVLASDIHVLNLLIIFYDVYDETLPSLVKEKVTEQVKKEVPAQVPCRSYAVRPRDQDDLHDDAHPEGENSAKKQKTRTCMKHLYWRSHVWTNSTKQSNTKKSMEEISLTIDEAKLKKMADEMLRQRSTKITPLVQSCQRDPEAPALSLINQDLLYLKKGNSGPENIVLSLHKFPAIVFNDDDIEERTSRWVNKCIKKFNPYARYVSIRVNQRVEKHRMFSIIYEPVHGIIYKNSKKEKRVMRHSEIHKFCDATLNRVLEGLKSYNNDVKYGYVQRELTNDEVEYLKLFEEEIEVRLKHRNQMRRWEMYVNGRPLGPRRERPE